MGYKLVHHSPTKISISLRRHLAHWSLIEESVEIYPLQIYLSQATTVKILKGTAKSIGIDLIYSEKPLVFESHRSETHFRRALIRALETQYGLQIQPFSMDIIDSADS